MLYVGIGEICWLGVNSYIGYGVIVYGVMLELDMMIGMNVVVMDGVMIGVMMIVVVCVFVKVGYDVLCGVLLVGMLVCVVCWLSGVEIDVKVNGMWIY